jgi:hypothetical protein
LISTYLREKNNVGKNQTAAFARDGLQKQKFCHLRFCKSQIEILKNSEHWVQKRCFLEFVSVSDRFFKTKLKDVLKKV